MGEETRQTSHDPRDEDDDDESDYDETDGGNRMLGFMFGNVDDAGDLDADYLDKDAKEHIAALADKLGSSLTDIDLSIKSSQRLADASEQGYDEKAEDAVDYEDIDEQYEGPETITLSEEDHLLPQKEYFSAGVSVSTMEHKNSVFDEENYDEDEDLGDEHNMVDNSNAPPTVVSAGSFGSEHSLEPPYCGGTIGQRQQSSPERGGFTSEQLAPYDDGTIEQCQQSSPDRDEILELLSDVEKASEVTLHSVGSSEDEKLALDLEDSQDEAANLQESFNETSVSSLPILCIEDGMEVLRFSEIFGIHEPLKKGEKLNRRYPIPKEKYNILNASVTVEEDEEAFLRGSSQGFVKPASRSQTGSTQVKENDTESVLFGFCQGVSINPTEDDEQKKNLSLFAEPMKENVPADLAAEWGSPACPKFYPLDQQEWEDEIIWGNSPLASHTSSEICTTSGIDSEAFVNIERDLEIRPQDLVSQVQMEPNEEGYSLFLRSFPVSEESFGSRNISDSVSLPSLKNNHPQLLRLESCMRVDDSNYSEGSKESATEHLYKGGTIKNFSKLSLQNLDMLEDSWLGKIIWDPDVSITKPKLILDLRDEQMLFEILETQDVKDLRLHAGAMIVTRSTKANGGDSFDLPGQGGASIGRFNISNDKYYSNRKTSQQLKSHSKKRAAHGVKVLHSTPALKLQTMKPKLSNKDIANFHRPKALWYPHDNEVAAREQGKLSTQGPMKIILRSMGGKGSKLHVNAEETISSVIAKASKKLDFKPSEKVQIFYSGKELEESKSLAEENVRPNSVLHLVRTKIHLWPRAQKLPGENKSLRPPGAFKKKSDLSVKDGHVFLMEYCEERPLLLGNVGMGARLCTYYQKVAPGDQKASLLRNESSSLGNILTLDPADKSPFLGDIKPGFNQSCIETNMYRAPIFPHKLPSTDYLLVRSSKGKLSLRRIDRVDVVGQQEPHMEVISPGTKNLQTYIVNRLLVHIYREFRAIEKRGLLPRARADELSAQFPSISEPFLRKRLKHCADLQRGLNGQLFWVKRRNFRIPLEEELRRMVTPENVCAYESMQAGLYRLKRLGISRLTHPTGLSSAMNQLPDEAIALAAASHIERELQITPWNLSSNFVACTNQDRENIERLEITGVGDPSGRGLGFSYVRVAPKAPMSSAVVKKKTTIPRGAATVTGTDADLRRLSMEAAREVLLKFNVPEEQIAKQTRWHRIAMIRKLSSEQAASGVKVDPTTISKYARGQRMSFLQLQQQTREKCQEIWDRQLLSLSAADGDEIDSDSEPNSDLDSFAGDLENLLDAEECGTGDGNYESKHSKADGAMGLKMRRHSSQPQADEEIEDEAAEAAELCRMLMDDDESEQRKKKPGGRDVASGWQSGFVDQTKCTNTMIKQIIRKSLPDGSFTSKETIIRDPKQVEGILAKRTVSGKVKVNKGNGKNDIAHVGPLKKQIKVIGDGLKVNKEKKPSGKGRRDEFTCSACGQSGHMKTNKNCPEYGKEHGKDLQLQVESTVSERASGKSNSLEPHALLAQKTSTKKLIPKGATKIALVETSDNTEKEVSTPKVIQLKVKCAPPDKLADKMFSGGSRSSDKQVASDAETGMRKINKIIISNKMKPEDVHIETPKPSVVIRPPAETEMDQPRKKIIIKQSKVVINVDQVRQEVNSDFQEDYRKTKKMSELSSMEKHKKQESKKLAEETALRKAMEERRLWEEEEEEKRRRDERNREERERLYEEEKWVQAKQQRLADVRYETMWKEEPEQHHAKKKKKKKKLPEMADEYFNEQRPSRSDQRLPERNRGSKRRPVMDLGRYSAEHAPQTKRRRGGAGEVGLANILESIVESLRDATEVSYLFLKPVSKKEAPDYLDVIKHPMDLATIKEKVRKMEYKSREDFRHDVWQITFNAHQYNDGRNPGIPPLADQLLELCDYLLEQNDERLCEAEAGIEIIDP